MKVMIVDDHALVRRGMGYVVKECFPEAEVHEAGGADEALRVMEAHAIEIALVDVRMPDLDGLELLRTLKGRWPDVPVIMLSTYDQALYVKRALADGAAGYMLKDATTDDLGQAIRVALSGSGNVLSPRVIQNLFEDNDEAGLGGDQGRRPEFSLTHRERDILGLLAEGREQPRHRGGTVPFGEDGQGAPGCDLPQAGRHQPHAGGDGRGRRWASSPDWASLREPEARSAHKVEGSLNA